MPIRRIFRDSRGANLVEYLILLGVVSLLALGAWRKFGETVRAKVNEEAVAVAKLEAAPGSPGVATRGADGKLQLNVLNPQCFAAGTLVKTAAGPQPIERVQADDLVWSRDEATADVRLKPVVQTFVTPSQPLVDLVAATRDGRTEHLRVTPGHRFWVEGRGWKAAESLAAGEAVAMSDGTAAELVGASSLAERATVYNLEVDEFHTYFVGGSGLLVHNADPKNPNDCNGASAGPGATALNDLYGEPQPPGGPFGIKPFEKDKNGNVIKNPTLQVVQPGSPLVLEPGKDYIWVVTQDGALVVGEEVKVGEENGRAQKLGHPTLTDGQPARIGGELRYEDGKWIINNKSGRYSGHPDRGPEQLDNVAGRFEQAGAHVQPKYLPPPPP